MFMADLVRNIEIEYENEAGDIASIDLGKQWAIKVSDMNLKENSIEVKTSSRFLNLKDIRKNSIIESGATIFPKRGGAIATNKKRIITNTHPSLTRWINHYPY